MSADIQMVFEQLGGKKAIGRKVESESEMDVLLRQGLPIGTLVSVRENWQMTVLELSDSLSIPKSTLLRKVEKNGRMDLRESDRVFRLARILSLAEDSIGDLKKARLWLRQPNKALGMETPLRALETEIGAQRVVHILGNIAYGGIA